MIKGAKGLIIGKGKAPPNPPAPPVSRPTEPPPPTGSGNKMYPGGQGGSLGLTRRMQAAINLLYPEEMTPTAKRVLELILEDERITNNEHI